MAFFDALESRPLASYDDAIHAALLLGTGSSGDSAAQRVAMAAQLGYVPTTFDRPAREAVTIGEVARMFAAILENHAVASPERAITILQSRGVAVGSGQINQGLTGAQLMSVIGPMQDAMASAGVKKVPAPVVVLPLPAPTKAPNDVSTISAVDDRVPAPLPTANAALDSVGRSEPLPTIPPGANPPAIDVQDPKTAKPAVIGPSGAPTTSTKPKPGVKLAPMPPAPASPSTAVEPKPATALPTATPAHPATNAAASLPQGELGRGVWTRGRPLKQKAKPADPNAETTPATATAEQPKQ